MADTEMQTLDDVLLAKEHNTNADIVDIGQTMIKLVIFTLDENWYAFLGKNVKEVLSDIAVSALPGCPLSLEGVINVRGDIESVISLRHLFQYPPIENMDKTRILLGSSEAMRSGIRVDTVEEILSITEDSIVEPPATLPPYMAPIVSGVIQLNDQTVTILDLDKIFNNYHDGL